MGCRLPPRLASCQYFNGCLHVVLLCGGEWHGIPGSIWIHGSGGTLWKRRLELCLTSKEGYDFDIKYNIPYTSIYHTIIYYNYNYNSDPHPPKLEQKTAFNTASWQIRAGKMAKRRFLGWIVHHLRRSSICKADESWINGHFRNRLIGGTYHVYIYIYIYIYIYMYVHRYIYIHTYIFGLFFRPMVQEI